jgi:putative DNA primase/helicase
LKFVFSDAPPIATIWHEPEPGANALAIEAQMAPRALYRAPQHRSARTAQIAQWAAARHSNSGRYPEDDFRDAMREHLGHAPARIVADGKIHRFSTNKNKRDDAGWYLFFDDGLPAGEFGDWRTGEQQTWHANGGAREFAPADRQRMKEREAEREKERNECAARVSREAQALWNEAPPADPNHPYLVEKGIAPHGVREDRDGRLLVPVTSADGALMSLQTIAADGEKMFLKDGRTVGGLFWLGEPGETIGIGEGFRD